LRIRNGHGRAAWYVGGIFSSAVTSHDIVPP
jgi:hypothetical protein